MHSVLIGLCFAASMFICGVAGMAVNRRAPERHFTENARDLLKLVVALTSTLSAMVLGLLVASSYSVYTTQKAGLQTLSARAVEINRMLVQYGADVAPGQELLKLALEQGLSQFWGVEKPNSPTLTLSKAAINAPFQAFGDYLGTLKPDRVVQTRLLDKIDALYSSMIESHDMMYMQLSNPIAWQLLLVLASWTSALFFGLGLLSRIGATSVGAIAVGAVIMAGAIFLILDLSQPYSGVIRLSPAPLEEAIKFVRD